MVEQRRAVRRADGRRPAELRPVRLVPGFLPPAERSVLIDCDVLQADGGTRTAAVTGGYVALALALDRLRAAGVVAALPLTGSVAGVSAGIVDGRQLLDLAYEEDHRAEVDMNVVM